MIVVADDVLADPLAYRTAALETPFRSHHLGNVTFHGIGLAPTGELDARLLERFDGAIVPRTTFLRQSPEGQEEPNYIHTDLDMGTWTGILYLTPDPPEGDGTTFWQHVPTGRVVGVPQSDPGWIEEVMAWRQDADWRPWQTVQAQFNRLVLFDAGYFHSRALRQNYGAGEDARLIQIVFGTGEIPPCQ